MITIYKYELEIKGRQAIPMPDQAEILDVQNQRGILVLWAKADTTRPFKNRLIEIYGTGHRMAVDTMIPKQEYVATVQVSNLVWHVFDLGYES